MNSGFPVVKNERNSNVNATSVKDACAADMSRRWSVERSNQKMPWSGVARYPIGRQSPEAMMPKLAPVPVQIRRKGGVHPPSITSRHLKPRAADAHQVTTDFQKSASCLIPAIFS